MAARQSIDEKLDALDALGSEPDESVRSVGIKLALGDRHYRVVARAAHLAADALMYEFVPALLSAYRRFLDKPVKSDPNCFAKKAIVRALVNLECDDVTFYLEGIRYAQLEPLWGGATDTAVDVRSSCAMGLVATGYPRALVELTELLNDPETQARSGAVRAVACGNAREAELLLRAKLLAGDDAPEVVGQCFEGLLTVEPDESASLVARYLSDDDETVREFAAFALGESKLESALEFLTAAWDEVFPPPGFRRVLVQAIAMHRSDAAFDWLTSLVEDSPARVVDEIIEALVVCRHNSKLTNRLAATLVKRGDRDLQESFENFWKASAL